MNIHHFQDYAVTIANQLGVKGPNTGKGQLGRQMNMKELDWFSEEQVLQLHELMKAAKNEPDGSKIS